MIGVLCVECGAPAVLRLESDGAGRWVCNGCADRQVGLSGLSDLVRALGPATRSEKICPFCKTTAEEALETGLAGCPLCYESLPQVWKHFGIAPGNFPVHTLE